MHTENSHAEDGEIVIRAQNSVTLCGKSDETARTRRTTVVGFYLRSLPPGGAT